MKPLILILTLTIASCGFLGAQSTQQRSQQQQSAQASPEKKIKSRNGRVNKSIGIANDAFRNERYFKAYGYYDRAFRRESQETVRMQLRERLGETQRRLNNPVEAVVYFDRVWDGGNRDKDFLMSYADVLLKTANYEKAEMIYQTLYKSDTSDVFIKNRVLSSQLGLAYSDTLDVVFRDQIRPQHRLSTPFSQYGLVIVDGKLIYSSSQRVNPPATDYRTGHGFSHLYTATLRRDSLLWEKPTPLSFNIWGDVINDGVFSYDAENKVGYFQRCNQGNCGIYTTTYEGGNWTIPQKFEVNGIGATHTVGHPAISPDGKRLIFVSKAPDGEGGSDLWMTTKIDRPQTASAARRRSTTPAQTTSRLATSRRASSAASRQTEKNNAAPPAPTTRRRTTGPIINNPDWTVPVNLGKNVNTPGDEVFPIWINNEAIAFSSNGHVGYGGLDIYVAIADENGEFTDVRHIESPINSSFDDYTLVIDPNIEHIFFSSSRYIGFGHSDEIYSFPKTASVLEFRFDVTDASTDLPLANATISVCERDTCQDVTTDEFGKAKHIRPKTSSVYDITFAKDDYENEERQVKINSALDIIPLRDIHEVAVALHRDTTVEEVIPPAPVEEIEEIFLAEIPEEEEIIDDVPLVTWFYAVNQTEGDPYAELVATAVIKPGYELISEQPQNQPFEPIVFRYNFDPDNFDLSGPVASDVTPSSKTIPSKDEEAEPILVSYYTGTVTFTQPVQIKGTDDFRIIGNMSYMIGENDEFALQPEVPLSFPIFGVKAPVVEPEEDDTPAVIWYYAVNQLRDDDSAELVATAFIRPDVFMISDEQLSGGFFSPVTFRFNPDPEKYDLVGKPTADFRPFAISNPFDVLASIPISLYRNSVTFTQKINVKSPDDFRITGDLDYMVGFDNLLDLAINIPEPNPSSAFTPFRNLPLSFPIFGIGEEEDLSWADEVTFIDNPVFTYRQPVNECDSLNIMADCMKPGMTPQQIIDCIDKKRRDCEAVDLRVVDNYTDRINDPNRRANMTVLPKNANCKDCGKEPQRHLTTEPLYILGGEDKQTLKFTDNGGYVTYFDLTPNTKYEILVRNFVSDNMAHLPDHIRKSDIVKTVVTRDYVIYECVPKLSEIGDETYVNNIYYDFDQSGIIKDGHRELDRLIVVAMKNPHMMFEITSHADERGSVEYNQALTERRMNSVLDYVRRKGLDMGRLITRAVGKSEPLVKNAVTEEEHALNRRATVRLYDPTATNELKDGYEIHENTPFNTKGLKFRVQIGAFKEAPEYPLYLFNDYLKAAPQAELTYYQDRDGLYKFTMGDFSDLDEARRLNKRILDANKESYVVAFMDGQRITVAEAQAIMKRMAKR
jgi:outer membrane protein OmpA-like peptidoglycan-associated protein